MREIGANGREALISGKDPDMSVKPAVSADMDELDAAQSELAMMRRRLRAAAHEIRTPLAGAATIIDILAASDAAEGPMRDYVFLLRDAVAQLVAVTNDMLDLGRLEANLGLGPREGFSPAEIIASVAGLARPRAEAKGLALTVSVSGLPERLVGYPMALRRAVENLVDNAVKNMEAGEIAISAAMSGDRRLAVEVRDTGFGIAAQDLHRIFEPYTQLSSGQRAGGTGLGLPLVKAAVERSGGSIEVSSRPGEGSTFRFSVAVEPAEAVRPPPQRSNITRRPLTILVAEDNPVNRIVVGAILGEFGHRVVFSPDGLAAVEALRERAFDLVLMDMEMPGLDGPAALAEIRRLPGDRSQTPVVALSAQGPEGREDALGASFHDYVAKPIDPAALFAAIEAAMAGREPR
jgi:CheY-like chemotaxis protein